MSVIFKDRIKEFRRLPPEQILPCPDNWRLHPENQKENLRAVLREVGVADAVLVRQVGKNQYMLIDGHLRHEELGGLDGIPSLILDVDENEARILLATLDPLSAMAGSDPAVLRDLLARCRPGEEAVIPLFSEISRTYGAAKQVRDGEVLPEEEQDEVAVPDAPPEPSHVRMLQLFLNTETLPPFQEKVEYFAAKYGTFNPTDTVLKVFEVLYNLEKARDD